MCCRSCTGRTRTCRRTRRCVPDGRIALPLINEVQAAGLTPEQLHKKLTEESKKYMEDANITVVVREINSRKAFITGEVQQAGSVSADRRRPR